MVLRPVNGSLDNTRIIGTIDDPTFTGRATFEEIEIITDVNVNPSITRITASTTQTQGEQELVGRYNEVTTVANVDDVVSIRTQEEGVSMVIVNKGANRLQIFPGLGDSIGDNPVNTSVFLEPGATLTIYCADPNWIITSLSSGVDPLARANHTGTQIASTISDFDTQVRTNRLDQMAVPTANLSINSNKLINVTNPTSDQDGATKNYVDTIAAGARDFKNSVRVATTANITLSGEQTIDGVTTSTDRILVKDQSSAEDNGIYVTAAGAWSRSTDADTDAEVTADLYVWVEEGTLNGDEGFLLITDNPITLGVTSLSFTQVSGLGSIVAGTGLDKAGNTLNIDSTVATLTGSQTLTNKSIVATQLTGIIEDARMPNLTGDVTTVEGAVATTIGAGKVIDAMLSTTGDAMLATITYIIDGGGVAITTGLKGDLEIPFNCTIERVTMLADQSGSIVVDIFKDTFANYPPLVGDSITASAKPTISTAVKSQDATLTGWTTSVVSGDTLRYNVDSITSITRLTISLKVRKT